MNAPFRLWISILVVALTLTGCSKPSREDKITARDDTSFELWLADHRDVLTLAEVKELNTARQQIRYKVMQARPGQISADSAAAVYAEIDGRTVRELLLTAYALQIERMKTELLNYQPQLERFQEHQQNKQLDAEQQKTVSDALEKLHRLMREHQDELQRLTQRVAEIERNAPAAK